ncbi:murein hydrolase activator EnvC family protein [Anaerosporobacter sp.]
MRRKKRMRRFGILMLVSILTFTSVYTIFASEINDAKSQKSDLEKKKEETEAKIKELEKEKGNIVSYIEKMDVQLNDLNEEITDLNQQIEEANVDLDETKKNLKEAKKTEKNQYETMKKRIKYMYENGNTNYIEIILGSADMSDMLNRAEYIEKIMQYDRTMLSNYQETKKQIELTKKDIENKIVELEELTEEVNYEKQTVEDLVDKKSEELAKYNANIQQSESMVSNYSNAIAEQEALIEKLLEEERKRIEEEEKRKKEEEERRRKEEEEKKKQEQSNNSGNSSNNNSSGNSSNSNSSNSNSSNSNTQGGFTWPVPASKKITSYFGYRGQPTSGASTYHQGIDIGAPTGTSIVAAQSGTVVTASYSAGAGNYIMINHGNSVYTVYMHCSQLLVSVGQTVSRGEQIALVGSTGISTGPHLHFGVSVNGSYKDPLNYVN